MQGLKNLKLISSEVKLTYSGKNEQGTTIICNDVMTPDPAWTAVLMRYLHHHKEIDRHCLGSRKISLQGSCSAFPKVEYRRWDPALPFNG